MKKLKIALVGVGQRGLQHLQALSDLKDEELISIQALVDPFKENLDNEKIKSYVPNYDEKGVKYFNKFNEMVDSVNVDAIWFVIPPNQHKNEIIYAADKGIAIFAEKPQSLFLDEVFLWQKQLKKKMFLLFVGFKWNTIHGIQK
ncbi:MAG: hypothetical protein CM15mP129_07310 [Chloroflexota bacterium]|nr:MAG: hypothetical protein CM15mP129_07310 [Chloroflexota bacterium]